jgi:hypothetical protein
MNIAFVYFSFNRLSILKESLRTSLSNTNIKPNHIYIFDDHSNEECQNYLKNFKEKNKELNITLNINQENIGYAANYRKCFDILKNENFDYIFFLETDYIWRKGYLEECIELLEMEQDSVAVCGSSFKEFYEKEKCITWFANVTKQQFGKDVSNRPALYTSKILKLKSYNMTIQYGTHSCGTFLFNKKRFFNNLNEDQKSRFWVIMQEATKVINNKSVINDGMITGGISILWDEYLNLKHKGNSFEKSAFIDIIDYVIGVHIEGGGINGSDNPEGYTRYFPDKFPKKYDSFLRNEK